MVYPQQNSALRLSNRANLRYGESPDDHVYDCTCGWCLRWKMPCRHIIAAAKGDNTGFMKLLQKYYKVSPSEAFFLRWGDAKVKSDDVFCAAEKNERRTSR